VDSAKKSCLVWRIVHFFLPKHWTCAGDSAGPKIRAEGFIRSIYLYPMALSFVVTGTAWKWILNPGLGIEKLAHDFGFTNFTFDWLINSDFRFIPW